MKHNTGCKTIFALRKPHYYSAQTSNFSSKSRLLTDTIHSHLALTQVEDAVPWPVPAPAFQLLVLCVLKPTVVKHHTDDALEYREVSLLQYVQGNTQTRQHAGLDLSFKTAKSKDKMCACSSPSPFYL